MHRFPVLSVACDTAQTAGMTEGAEVGNETNCLHFLRVQPLRGTPMNITEMATNLRLRKNNDSHKSHRRKVKETDGGGERLCLCSFFFFFFCCPGLHFQFLSDNKDNYL